MTKQNTDTKSSNETRDLYFKSPASEKKISLASVVIICFITLFVGFGIGLNWKSISSGINSYLGGKTTTEVDFSKLNEVYEKLAANFDGEIDKTKVIEEAKRGLVNAAGDKYTYYMTATEAKEFEKDLSGDVGAGIGVEIGERDGVIKVLRTTPDNPARRAGVLAGDIIYKANGEDISNLKVDDVANKLRGAEGTSVVLTVVRNSKELDFTLTRETINNVSAYVDYKGDAAVLTITRFDQDTGTLVKKLAQEILGHGSKKVIVDLRGNGGGYVSSAREVASLWLNGDLVYEQRSTSGLYSEQSFAKSGTAILAGMKTIVLINGSTASASEIVAGALKDHDKATLIGEKTYGKGSVQSLEQLSSGELLRVTIAKWYTPKGRNINNDGIEPDIKVERTFEQINKEIDPQLEAALNQ
jgi:carboxyl-terminal processing protease